MMSGGRVELGLGAGWFEPEHTAYAIPFPPTGTWMEMLEEQLAIVSGLWETKEGDRFSFEGRLHYAVTDSPALPKPAQRPHPPIIVGGSGAKRTPPLTATYADEFNLPMTSVEACGVQRDNVVRRRRGACDAIRDHDVLAADRRVLRPQRRGDRPARRPSGGRRHIEYPVRRRQARRGDREAAALRRARCHARVPVPGRHPRPRSLALLAEEVLPSGS